MDIERTFDRAGATWTAEERLFVLEWLYLPPQHIRLLTFARRNLGVTATSEDAEDTWQEFSAGLRDSVIEVYDPRRGKRFWSFLLYPCFQQYCWKRRAAITSKVATESAPADDVAEVASRSLEDSIIDRDVVLTGLRMLDSACRDLVVMAYFEGRSSREIAKKCGISEPNARVRLHRCVRRLRMCLLENASA